MLPFADYYKRFALAILLSSGLGACQTSKNLSFTVKNLSEFDRTQETVSVPAAKIHSWLSSEDLTKLQVKEAGVNVPLVWQAIDTDGDGKAEEFLFQTDIRAGQAKKFMLYTDAASVPPAGDRTTYSRFVPERIDDYAWENDRVAFRTYGPEAQRLVDEKQPGGTLSSGMDAWFKRVPYPIIDKWYAGHLKEQGYYHKDHGEGYDPYHVGASRGVGGIGVWANDSLYVSKNFTDYKTIATGPIRTIFELSYAPWMANGQAVKEKKRISLDLGSNLSRYEVHVNQPIPNITAGLTLHDQKGQVTAQPSEGWYSYWEPMDGSELGIGLVMDPQYPHQYIERRVTTPDQSHLLLVTPPKDGKIVYYAGFGWKKSEQFPTKESWENYLKQFAQRLKQPLEVTFGP